MSFPLSDHETDDDMAVKDSLKSKVFDETMSRSNVSHIIVDKTNNIPGPWHHKLLSSIESLESELLVQAQSLQYENNDMDDIVATYIHSVEPEVDERCNTKKMTSPEVDCSSSVLPDLQNVSEDSNDFVEINKDDFSNKDIQRPEDEEDSYEFGDFQDERPNLSKENTSSKAVNTEHDEDSFTATATMVSLPKKDTERPEVIPSATDFEIFQSSKSLDSDKVEKKIGFSNFDPLFNDGVIKIGADKPSKEEEVIVGKLTQSSKMVCNQVRRNGNDEFGDFHESAVETPKAITESTNGDLWSSNKIPVLDVSDDIPVEMHMVVVSSETSPDDIEQSVHEKVNGDDDDDFGDFHESSGGQQIAVMESSASGDIWSSNNKPVLGVSDDIPVEMPTAAAPEPPSDDIEEPAPKMDKEDDNNFGDFLEASGGLPNVDVESANVDIWSSNKIPVLDVLDDIPVEMPMIAAPEPPSDDFEEPAPKMGNDDNDEFGDFHESASGIPNVAVESANGDLWSSNKIPVLDVSDDIPVEMHMVVVSSETSPDDIEQSVHEKVNGDDDDDFGDFHESSGGQQIAVMESANGDIWRSNNVVPNNVADKMQVSSVDFSEKAIYSDNERDENDVDDFGDFHDSSVGVSKATSDSAITDVWTSNTVLPSDIIPVKMSVVAVSEPAIDEVPIAAKVDNEYFENIHDASGGISPITTGLYNPDSTISANMALTSHYQSNGSLMTDPFEMITSSDACTDIIPNMSSIGQSEGTSDSYRGGIIASNEVSMGKVLQTNHHNNSFEHVNETVNSTVAVSEMFSSNSNQGIQQHSFSSRQHTNENVKVTHEQGDNNEKEKSNWNVDYNKANGVFSDLMPEITSTTYQNQFNQNGMANNINNGPHSYGVSPSDDNVNLHSQISNTNRGGRHEGNNAYGGGTFQHNSDLISTDQMQISNHLAQNFQASLDTMQEPDDAGARVPNNDSGILEMIKPSNVASSLHIMNISNIAPHLADEDEFGEFQST